ncbi:hypothetical protein Ahy_A01g002822 isoform C [Arachis hypogaea]|uniref:Uncharacterized protein n=1 Tax=Arachis hypogaea TaxID=3818 RepID=A0A445ERU2_ARAHY|nr:hypothetical protein Ahy_A01g002822 isoform C [Arachis hypogaea]
MFSSLHLSPDAETSVIIDPVLIQTLTLQVVDHVHVTRSNSGCVPTFSTVC